MYLEKQSEIKINLVINCLKTKGLLRKIELMNLKIGLRSVRIFPFGDFLKH